jgi:hypothetical protein
MYTRRTFLVKAIWLAVLPASTRALALQNTGSVNTGELTDSQLAILTTAMDQIIPAVDGMPSASQAGGFQYLRSLGWQYREIRDNMGRILNTLEEMSEFDFHRTFPELDSGQRFHVLRTMEKSEPATFSTLMGYVYEAYYTNPRVLGLMSCPPSSAPAAQDEALLAPVKRFSHLYREVP